MIAVVLVSLIPHAYFFLSRGREWNGTFPLTHDDEITYASHVSALIKGNSRHYDPYTGQNNETAETYLSIQFIPSLVLAAIGRVIHVDSLQLFFVLTITTAAFAFIALYWMFQPLFLDPRISATAALIVLCLGTAHLWAGYVISGDAPANYLGFLRRHVPAFPFAFLFLFIGAVWRSLNARQSRAGVMWIAAAAICFAVLVYSYFYLWTAAATWLFIVVLLSFISAEDQRLAFFKRLVPLIGIIIVTLVPYVVLLSRRVESTDEAMLITHSHAPDLLRFPELVGLIIVLGMTLPTARRMFQLSRSYFIFILAFALTPFLIFNQQIVTGRSLQSFHFSVYSVNYMALAGLLMLLTKLWKGPGGRSVPALALILLSITVLASGSFEGLLAGRRYFAGNVLRDEARPVLFKFAQLAHEQPSRSIVLCTDPTVADAFPTLAPQPVLWARHMFNHGITLAEDKERLSLYLYLIGTDLSGVGPNSFANLDGTRKYFVSSLIGRGRNIPYLRPEWKPISPNEVSIAVADYSTFVAKLDRSRVEKFLLTYVVTRDDERIDFTNLDRWYERSAAEHVGRFSIFRVKLRS